MSAQNRVRILIVDDHDGLRLAIRNLLECQRGFEICGEAKDGAAGVEKVAVLKPDVVILNIVMPVMDGFEAGDKSWLFPLTHESSCCHRTQTNSYLRKPGTSARFATCPNRMRSTS